MNPLRFFIFALLVLIPTTSCATTSVQLERQTICANKKIEVLRNPLMLDRAMLDRRLNYQLGTMREFFSPRFCEDIHVRLRVTRPYGDEIHYGVLKRGDPHTIDFFVEEYVTAKAISDGWIATHELSHLVHPYLGKKQMWFTEGLATYLQEVLRARAGVISQEQLKENLMKGFNRGYRAYPVGKTLVELSAVEEKGEVYTPLYWGGAAFWYELDVFLRSKDSCLLELLKEAWKDEPKDGAWDYLTYLRALSTRVPQNYFQMSLNSIYEKKAFPRDVPGVISEAIFDGQGVCSYSPAHE